MSDSDRHDPENPPFEFARARKWQPGDPESADSARLFRLLRRVVSEKQAGHVNRFKHAVDAFKGDFEAYEKG